MILVFVNFTGFHSCLVSLVNSERSFNVFLAERIEAAHENLSILSVKRYNLSSKIENFQYELVSWTDR